LFQVFSPQQVATLYKSFSRNTYSNVREKFSKLAYTIEGRNLQDMYGRSGTYWRKEELAALGVTDVQGLDSLYSTLLVDMDARAQMQLWDMAVYLPDDILVKSDRATMAVGLEGREPFLDHTLIEFLATIPAELRYAHFEKKHIQRQLLGKYLDLSLFERPKTGFRPPIDTWLRTSLSGTLDRYLSVEYIEKQGIFDPTAMATLLKRFRSRRYVNPDKIWLLLQFQMWWKTYMA